MKKYSKLALMLALMLSMSTVMAACDDPGTSHQKPQTPEEIANEGYKAAAAEWEKYVEYVAPETTKKLEKTTLKTQKEDKSLQYNAAYGYYCVVDTAVTEKTFTDDEAAAEPVSETKTTKTTTTQTYFDKDTHEELFKTVTVSVVKDGDKALDSELKPTAEYRQQMSTFYEHVLQVSKTTKVLKTVEEGAEPLDETLFSSYEEKTVYSYYHLPTKTWIAENLETYATKRDNDSIAQQIIDIGDKTYLFDKTTGEIVKTYDLGMEYAVPSFDASNPQFILNGNQYTWNAGGYGYYEQGEYAYYIKEAQPQTIQMGEIALVLMPEVSITVYKDGAITAEYASDAYAVAGYAVLPNGNVYVCEYKYLDADATEYDADLGGQKIDIVHTLLNVGTGATTDVNNSFLAQKVYTHAADEMTTFNSYLTIGSANDSLDNMKLKDGYVLAEVQHYSEGALQGESVFAVLNAETMEIVAELPKIVPNQFGYVGYLDSDTMFIQARVADRANTVLNYTVNTKTGDLELYLHNFNNVTLIENGFIYNDCVYDYNFNKLAVLDDHDDNTYNMYQSYQVIDGKVLVQINSIHYDFIENFNQSFDVAWVWASIKEVQVEAGGYWEGEKEEWIPEWRTETKWVGETPFHYTSDSQNETVTVVADGLLQISYTEYNAGNYNYVTKFFAYDGIEYDFNLGSRQETKTVTFEENSYTFYYDVVRTVSATPYDNGMVVVSVIETWTLNTSASPSTLPEGMEAPDAEIRYTEAYLLK